MKRSLRSRALLPLILAFSLLSFANSLSPSLAFALEVPFFDKEEEEFKGKPPVEELKLGVMTGLGVIDARGALGFALSPSYKVVDHGFVGDINNQVFAEMTLGGEFFGGESAFLYSAHLRWDFVRNSKWTYFALGGLGGNAVGGEEGRWSLAPRFGVGGFYRIDSRMTVRAEVSHEFTGIGVSFELL